MNLFSLKFSKKSTTLMVTIGVIALAYAYYFFVYVDNNERAYSQKVYRVLKQISKNIQEKHKGYSKNIQSNINLKRTANIENSGFILLEKGSQEYIYYRDSKDSVIQYKFPLDTFVIPVLKKDVIDEFIIIRGQDEKISYQTFSNKVIIDSLYQKHSNKSESIAEKIFVQGIEYKTFAYNFNFDGNSSWLIVGCMKNDKYIERTRSINFWLIINFFLLVMLLLVAMPMLKLALMNSIERLNQINVFLSGISIVVGAPLIILFVLVVFSYFQFEFQKTDNSLLELYKNVNSNFKNEIVANYNLLKKFNTSDFTKINKKGTKPSSNFEKIQHNWDKINFLEVDSINKILFEINSDPIKKFNEIYWIDNEGNESLVVKRNKTESDTAKKNNYELIKRKPNEVSLKSREYFLNTKLKKTWNLQDTIESKPINIDFYLQSIVSWTTNKSQISLAMVGEDDNFPVVAISSKFESVMDVILPMGYGFCFINEKGEVQIHSDSKKNLQENFLLECEDDSSLRSAIYSKNESFTTIDYLGKKHRAYIKPVSGTPFYMVVFHDLEYLKAKSSEIWSVSLILFLASFFTVGIWIFILYVLRRRSKKLLIKDFFFKWMSPKKELYKEYRVLSLANLVIIVFVSVVTLFYNQNNAETLFQLFLLPTLCLVISFYYLNNKSLKILQSGFMFLAIINIIYYFLIRDSDQCYIECFIFQLVILIIFPTLYWLISLGVKDKVKRGKKLNQSYSVFLLTWLVQSAVLPIILIYLTIYDVESNIWEKYTLYDFSKKLEKKDISNDKIDFNSNNLYGSFLNISKGPQKIDADRNTKLDTLMYHLRPAYKESIVENRGLVYSNMDNIKFRKVKSKIKDSLNSSWWSKIFHKVRNSNTITIEYKKLKGAPLYLSKDTTAFKEFYLNKYIANSIILVVLVGLIFFILYKLIFYCANKVYGLEFSKYFDRYAFKESEKEKIIKENNTILIGLPGSDIINEINNNAKITKLDCRAINISDIWKQERLKTKLNISTIILNNFDYNNDDHQSNSSKLEILEELLHKQCKIIIISNVNPTEIIDFYIRNIENVKSNVSGKIKEEYENALEKWRHVFCGFIEIYFPLKIDKVMSDKYYAKEMKYGKKLQKMYGLLNKDLSVKGSCDLKEDDVVIKIQQSANSYYFGLWNVLTRREQLGIYDLAKDGFINSSNKQVINTLLKKGLIRFENQIVMMNKSFSNFVLCNVKNKKVDEMDKEVNEKGKWVNIKLVIILVLIALISLIGFGQPDFFKNINAIVIALVGAASVLPALSNLFTFTRKLK